MSGRGKRARSPTRLTEARPPGVDALPPDAGQLLDAIESIGDGFALYNSDGRLLVCNSRYGKGTTEPQGLTAAEDGKAVVQRRGDHWLMLSERQTGDGGVVVVETDITELKKADTAKDEFLAKISHELRTPLTSIRGALALLGADNLVKPANLHRFVDLARRNCERLMCIVDDLLDMTRINAGSFNLELQKTGLEPIIEQLLESKRIGAAQPDIRLAISKQARRVQLMADPLRIQQVIDNFLTNAIKFGDGDAPIDIVVVRRKGCVRVSVKDCGRGIPEAFQPHVFDAFAQADSSPTRQKGGNGLGLSIAKTIIEAHRGRIGFASKVGKGTTFYFDLPLARRTQR